MTEKEMNQDIWRVFQNNIYCKTVELIGLGAIGGGLVSGIRNLPDCVIEGSNQNGVKWLSAYPTKV